MNAPTQSSQIRKVSFFPDTAGKAVVLFIRKCKYSWKHITLQRKIEYHICNQWVQQWWPSSSSKINRQNSKLCRKISGTKILIGSSFPYIETYVPIKNFRITTLNMPKKGSCYWHSRYTLRKLISG